MSAASFADSANAAAPLARLSGSFGAVETIRRSSDTGAANPFYLDKPVTDCDHVTLELSVTERSGWCGANYYIYVRDAAGDWHHTGVFRLREENVNGQPYTYEIDLDNIDFPSGLLPDKDGNVTIEDVAMKESDLENGDNRQDREKTNKMRLFMVIHLYGTTFVCLQIYDFFTMFVE